MAIPFQAETDEALVIHYRATGDKNAVGLLFKRHTLMCFAVCNKYLRDEDAAEDAVMQVFEKLFTDLKKHDIQNFKSWLHSVCRNYCLMQLRKNEVLVRMDDDEGEYETNFMEFGAFLHQEENATDKEQRLQVLEHAMGALNDKQRTCIELFYLQQKSYEEVSGITGLSAKEVKSSLQNGKRNLKIILTNKGIALLLIFTAWLIQRI